MDHGERRGRLSGIGRARAGRAARWPCRARCLVVAVVPLAIVGCGAIWGGGPPIYEVQAATIAGLGKVIVDGQGFTLYIHVPDHQGASMCYRRCVNGWPPLVLPRGVTRPKAGPGIRAALLGTVRRSDGALQVTYNKWPLYLWRGDTAPGWATGQAYDLGVGLWYTLSVTGAVDKGTVAEAGR